MRPAAIQILVIGFCALAPDAAAQFPFLGGQTTGAELRLAGQDRLADEIEGFISELKRLQINADSDLQALGPQAQAGPRGLRLFRLGELRSRALATGLSTARHALVIAQSKLPDPEAVNLKQLIDQHEEWKSLEQTSQRQRQVARRIELLASDRGRAAALPPLEAAEFHMEQARARVARAQAFESQASTRSAERAFSAGLTELVIRKDESEIAILALQSAEAELLRLQSRVATGLTLPPAPAGTSSIAIRRFDQYTESLMRARTEADRAQVDATRARVSAAQALVWALEALQRPGRPAVWSQVLQVEATIAEVQEQRNDSERALRALRGLRVAADSAAPDYGLLVQQETHFERGLDANVEQQRSLRRAISSAQVVQALQRQRQSNLPSTKLLGLILLTLLVGFGVLKFGGRFAMRLLSFLMSKAAPRSTARVSAVASLLWPVIVLGAVAAVIVWPILGLQLSLLEALTAVNRPLFYVDQTAVSPVSVLQFVVTVWAAVVISRLTRRFLTERVYPQTGWDTGLTNALTTMAHYGVVLIGLMAGLRFVGIGLSSLAIFAGVLSIGIGFGLRNITENFISGLIILAERPIQIGDFIEVKDGGVEGRVERIQARSTTVTTRDNITVIIPNSEFVSRPVVNWSHGDPKVRVSVEVGVAYGSDTDAVRKVLLEVASRHGKVLKKPVPEVQFRAFGASSLDFAILVWIDEQPTRFRIASDLHFAIDRAFRKRGIEIAFPQMDLHLKSLSPGVVDRLTGSVDTQAKDGLNIPDRKSIRVRPGTPSPVPKPGSKDD